MSLPEAGERPKRTGLPLDGVLIDGLREEGIPVVLVCPNDLDGMVVTAVSSDRGGRFS